MQYYDIMQCDIHIEEYDAEFGATFFTIIGGDMNVDIKMHMQDVMAIASEIYEWSVSNEQSSGKLIYKAILLPVQGLYVSGTVCLYDNCIKVSIVDTNFQLKEFYYPYEKDYTASISEYIFDTFMVELGARV